MTFRDITLHLEYCNCELIDAEGGYIVRNTISNKICFLPEDEQYYPLLVVQLCRTLQIECPACYEDDYHVFEVFAKKINLG